MKNWNIEKLTGYKPLTTYYIDFGLAETSDGNAPTRIQDTYNVIIAELLKDAKLNYKELTELVMVLNWKIWEHYNTDNEVLAVIYNKLWQELDGKVQEVLTGKELDYFYKTTD